MSGTVELIMFAVRSAVKLARTGRTIYVEDTRMREITLPLPAALSDLESKAFSYIDTLKRRENPDAYKKRYQELERKLDEASDQERKRIVQKIVQQYLLDAAKDRVPELRKNSGDLVGLTAIRQWSESEEPYPHPLQRAGGALVEVAVDYFSQVSGNISEDTKYGRTLKAFLEGLEQFDFQTKRWDSIVVKLFRTGMDAVDDHPELLAQDEETKMLVQELVTGVSKGVKKRLDQLPSTGDLTAEQRISEAGSVVLRSLLRNSGKVALNHPDVFGVESTRKQTVLQSVGSNIFDLMFDDTGDRGEYSVHSAVKRTFSTKGADRLVQSMLDAVAQHPNFFQVKDRDVRAWINRVVGDLHKRFSTGQSSIRSGLVIEVVSLAVKHGRHDLPALLNAEDEQDALLITVGEQILETIYEPGTDGDPGSWKLDLSQNDIRTLFSNVFRSLSEHPEWLFAEKKRQKQVVELLRFGIDALTKLNEGRVKNILRNDHLKFLLVSALKSRFLKDLNGEVTADQLGTIIDQLLSELAESGANVNAFLENRQLMTSFLRAVAESEKVSEVVGGSPEEREKLIRVIVELISQLVGEGGIDISEVRGKLKDI